MVSKMLSILLTKKITCRNIIELLAYLLDIIRYNFNLNISKIIIISF